jgi:hypothetical protein
MTFWYQAKLFDRSFTVSDAESAVAWKETFSPRVVVLPVVDVSVSTNSPGG